MNVAVSSLQAGKYGPFNVEWNARKKIWVVRADTERALNRFSLGTRRADGSKVVSSDADVEARVDKFFKKYIALVEKHKATEWPVLSGLAFDYEEDGFLKIVGEALAYYKASGALGAVSISKGVERHDIPQALIPPTQIEKVVKALVEGQAEAERGMAEVSELLQLTDPGPKPSVLGSDWPYVDCRSAGSEIIVSGLMVLLEGHRIEVQPVSYGGGYRPRFAVPAGDWVPTLRSIREMTFRLEQELLGNPSIDRLAGRADESIARFKELTSEGGFMFERRGPFVLFRIVGGFVRLGARWRWSIPEDAWAFSLIDLLREEHELGPDHADDQLDLMLDMAMVTAGLSVASCREVFNKAAAMLSNPEPLNFIFKSPDQLACEEAPSKRVEQPQAQYIQQNKQEMPEPQAGDDAKLYGRNELWVAKLLQPLRSLFGRLQGR